MKIEKLTPEQEKALPEFRQRYLDLACNGKRIERDKLQPVINKAYAMIGKKEPLLIILQSPQQAMIAIAFMKAMKEIKDDDELSSQLRSQLWSQLGSQLCSQLSSQLWSQLRSQLGSQLCSQLSSQLWSQLWSQLRSQLGSQLCSQLWSQLCSQLRSQHIYDGNYMWGSQDLYWISFYKFCEEIGVKYPKEASETLELNYRISSQCEWWWPYDGICFVSEKPTQIKWDENVLHNEHGPAVLYEDGYAVYSWRGTNIPKEWIEDKDSLTPTIALTWENVEQRRCAAEILGWHNVLEHPSLNPSVIDTDDDPQIGQLIEVDLPDVGRERFLKVKCGTGRQFALPCPPDVNTALDAQAWLNFCTPEDILSIEFRT